MRKGRGKFFNEANRVFLEKNYYEKGVLFCSEYIGATPAIVRRLAYKYKITIAKPLSSDPYNANYKHYLYRHIRLDKNEPFYVGIGTINPSGRIYNNIHDRAFDCHKKHNPIWGRIVNKTKYKVQIIFTSNDYNFIKQKEIEFIKLYGRKDLKTGTLANLTNGGEGSIGVVISENTRSKIRERNKNRRDIFIYNLFTKEFIGHFISLKLAAKTLDVSPTAFAGAIKRGRNYTKNYCFSFDENPPIFPKDGIGKSFYINAYDENYNLLHSCRGISAMSKYLRIESATICESIKTNSLLNAPIKFDNHIKRIIRNDGEIYNSLREASNKNNCSKATIARRIHSKKSLNGYFFDYMGRQFKKIKIEVSTQL